MPYVSMKCQSCGKVRDRHHNARKCHCGGDLMPTSREPESQETFDDSFAIGSMTADECNEKARNLVKKCQDEAAQHAAKWLLERGYFNGNIECAVYVYPDAKECNVQAVLTCYGLPLRQPAPESAPVPPEGPT